MLTYRHSRLYRSVQVTKIAFTQSHTDMHIHVHTDGKDEKTAHTDEHQKFDQWIDGSSKRRTDWLTDTTSTVLQKS